MGSTYYTLSRATIKSSANSSPSPREAQLKFATCNFLPLHRATSTSKTIAMGKQCNAHTRIVSANKHELEKSRTLTSVLEVDNKKLKKESEVRQLGGKMCVIYRLMREMHKPGNAGDKIVNVSNFT